MSCTNPKCALVPLKGGSPVFSHLVDAPSGEILDIQPYGRCRVVYIPCGGCLSCRRERRMELTLLQCCEASLHEDNWFITLTYRNDENDKTPLSLDRSHLSRFCESMRHHCRYNKSHFRFFACGEYGERYWRPHYHLSVFGVSPSCLGLPCPRDSQVAARKGLNHGKLRFSSPGNVDDQGNEYWQSPVISRFWPYGSHKIYRANRETFQYVAGYVTKKLTGKAGRDFESTGRLREFQAQSRPSIGFPWFKKFYRTIAQPNEKGQLINDTLSIAGVDWKCPRIFDKWLCGVSLAKKDGVLDSSLHFDNQMLSGIQKDSRSAAYQGQLVDRLDCLRKDNFERYRTAQSKQNQKHKEV